MVFALKYVSDIVNGILAVFIIIAWCKENFSPEEKMPEWLKSHICEN